MIGAVRYMCIIYKLYLYLYTIIEYAADAADATLYSRYMCCHVDQNDAMVDGA